MSRGPRNSPGYHLKDIPHGVYGEYSKICEEYEEFIDAMDQNNPVMALQELSDLLGAIEGFTMRKHNVTLQDLIAMANTTKRAFESGERKPKSNVDYLKLIKRPTFDEAVEIAKSIVAKNIATNKFCAQEQFVDSEVPHTAQLKDEPWQRSTI